MRRTAALREQEQIWHKQEQQHFCTLYLALDNIGE